jgi:hypothetical protein
MNKRLKELAEQAGATVHKAMHGEAISFLENDLERFAELVRQDEREACAKVAEQTYDRQLVHYPKGYYVDPNKMGEYSEQTAKRCAKAIRARGEK